MMKPIPAFYCCYLLRSTVRHQATYVGSTPNPVRRLKQHNGEAPGGAVRTSRLSLRPWEMTCIVSGFPSKVAALQFEWAWQNTHLTRHIPTGDRITAARTTVRVSPRTGRVRKRPTRPRMSLTDRLSNLHLLLRVKSFDRWPLRLTFFNEEVHRTWEKWLTQTPFRLRDGIIVQLEKHDTPKAFQRPETESTLVDKSDWIGKGQGIHGIDIGYAPIKAYLDKSIKALKRPEPMDCTVCKTRVSSAKSLLLVCPTQGCKMVSHITCLSRKFLEEECKAAAMVPLQGKCPSCQETLQWSTLMLDLSLRSRGEKEVAKLFRKGKSKEVEVADEDTEEDLSDGFADVDDWCDPEESDQSASKQRKSKSPIKARVEKSKGRPKTKKAAKSTSQKYGTSDDSWADAEVLD
ncbi:uncharacterized protein J3D65DRAFT_611762 [Phyllosticta citribraziliensis]|uniref:GIY-YIG domain-containing protein n=1 Tax=Phyllosticta citribraziliensis TaxID=989973 RepID=A0ABR1MB45_9PEZI